MRCGMAGGTVQDARKDGLMGIFTHRPLCTGGFLVLGGGGSLRAVYCERTAGLGHKGAPPGPAAPAH